MSNTVCYIGDQLNLDPTSALVPESDLNATPYYPQPFSWSLGPSELSSRAIRIMGRLALHVELVMQQRNLLALHPHHAEKLYRCLHYRDKIPRKYHRMYGDYFKILKRNRHGNV